MLFKQSVKFLIILGVLLFSSVMVVADDNKHADDCSENGLQTLYYKVSECAEMEGEEQEQCKKNACDRFKACLPLEDTDVVKNIKQLCE
jgi:hypothetical protein